MDLETFIKNFEAMVRSRVIITNEVGLKWLKMDIEAYFKKNNIKITKNE